jgi:hypothetical protein
MLHKALRVLFEIRLRWIDEVLQEDLRSGGLWIPETPQNRDKLDSAVALGNRLYGDQTHWVEKRQA